MGQIRNRGAFYQIRNYRNGQRMEESTGFTKYEKARNLLRDREGDISKGVPVRGRMRVKLRGCRAGYRTIFDAQRCGTGKRRAVAQRGDAAHRTQDGWSSQDSVETLSARFVSRLELVRTSPPR